MKSFPLRNPLHRLGRIPPAVWVGFLFLLAGGAAMAEPVVDRYSNGTVRREWNADENRLPHGWVREYDRKGRLRSEKNYVHGVPQGIGKLYYPNGQLMTLWHYQDGKREGESVGYYKDGSLKDKGYYVDDQLHGTILKYYRDGTLKAEMRFKEDRLEGLSRTYHPNGTLKHEYTYRKGRLAHSKTYDSQGHLVREQKYPVFRPLP